MIDWLTYGFAESSGYVCPCNALGNANSVTASVSLIVRIVRLVGDSTEGLNVSRKKSARASQYGEQEGPRLRDLALRVQRRAGAPLHSQRRMRGTEAAPIFSRRKAVSSSAAHSTSERERRFSTARSREVTVLRVTPSAEAAEVTLRPVAK